MTFKRISLAFVILFFIALAYARTPVTAQDTTVQELALAGREAGTPRVVVSETHFDFGEVRDGDDYVHAFTIMNLGTGVLEIKNILPG